MEAGIDPVSERRRASGIPTFKEAAKRVHAEHKRGWKNGKHQAQWLKTLETYAFPHFGEQSVSQIDSGCVRDALAAIWLTKPETARRLRQRISAVIDWAVAKGYRENSLAMAVIDKALPKQRDRVSHFQAMPYADLPSFMTDLRSRESVSRLALEAVILTAARSGEVRLATWNEVDLENRIWTIPAARMKAGREHIIPLSDAAVEVFKRAQKFERGPGAFVFPGTLRNKPLSDMTLTKILRDQKRTETVHGFRSSFRDWVAERTAHPADLAEVALAHVNSNKTEAAYLRSDQREKRRKLMQDWADFCLMPAPTA